MPHDPSFTYLWRKINLGSRWFQFLTRSSTVLIFDNVYCGLSLTEFKKRFDGIAGST